MIIVIMTLWLRRPRAVVLRVEGRMASRQQTSAECGLTTVFGGRWTVISREEDEAGRLSWELRTGAGHAEDNVRS